MAEGAAWEEGGKGGTVTTVAEQTVKSDTCLGYWKRLFGTTCVWKSSLPWCVLPSVY